MAAMTLSLAHLDAHNRRTATNFLAHQRLSDRAMRDRVLQIMDLMRDSKQTFGHGERRQVDSSAT